MDNTYRKYPIGISSFETIRDRGMVYVDKTDLIWRLVNNSSYVFLGRPRRFGKSLLVSTMEAYFKGERHYFAGLKIEVLEKEWICYPVLHFDFTGSIYNNTKDVSNAILSRIETMEQLYGIKSYGASVAERFGSLIENISKKSGKQVVVLIDEYDKPLLDNIENLKLQKEIRKILKGFYGNLKNRNRYIRFALLTGVSRFSKVSIFSDLNNLDDISLLPEYNDICGITEDELHATFADDIKTFAKKEKATVGEIKSELRRMYDGYHFSYSGNGIYNPFSLLATMQYKEWLTRWFDSGTPTFLVKLLQKGNISLAELAKLQVGSSSLVSDDIMSNSPVAVMYQSGYLTIKGYDRNYRIYTLGFPNKEVIDGFFKFLWPMYANVQADFDADFNIMKFQQELLAGDVDAFMQRLNSFFSTITYETIKLDYERHYQNILFTIFTLLGTNPTEEFHTSSGRADCVLQLRGTVFIFEFKLDNNGSADDAIRQIEDKEYAAPFSSNGKEIIGIGVVFSNKTHNICDWKAKTLRHN